MLSLKAGIQRVHADAAGVLEILMFRPKQVDELILDALLLGDAAALRLVDLVAQTTAHCLA